MTKQRSPALVTATQWEFSAGVGMWSKTVRDCGSMMITPFPASLFSTDAKSSAVALLYCTPCGAMKGWMSMTSANDWESTSMIEISWPGSAPVP